MFYIEDTDATPVMPTRIPASTTARHFFQDGNARTGTPATVVTEDFLNIVQNEMCNLVEASGITLDKMDDTQLTQAVVNLIKNYNDNGSAGDSNYKIMYVRDEKPLGTPGGNVNPGAWRTRDLNAIKFNTIPDASLANNRVILPPGTYYIRAKEPHYSHQAIANGTGDNQGCCRIYNITGSATIMEGTSVQIAGPSGSDAYAYSCAEALITAASTTEIELQYFCLHAVDMGLGAPSNTGTMEVYSEMTIQKIK